MCQQEIILLGTFSLLDSPALEVQRNAYDKADRDKHGVADRYRASYTTNTCTCQAIYSGSIGNSPGAHRNQYSNSNRRSLQLECSSRVPYGRAC